MMVWIKCIQYYHLEKIFKFLGHNIISAIDLIITKKVNNDTIFSNYLFSSTTFKQASTNSVNIGSCIYSLISNSGSGAPSKVFNISLRLGFSKQFFNSFDFSVKKKYIFILN